MIRNATVVTLLTAAAFGIAVFALKYKVQGLEEEYTELNRAIIADRQATHVLRAEWSHLNEPRRLRDLSARFLDLQPVVPSRVGTLAALPGVRPESKSEDVIESNAKPTVRNAPSSQTALAKVVPPPKQADISNDEFARIISQALADRRSSR